MAFGTGHGITLTFSGQGIVVAIRQVDPMQWQGESPDFSHVLTKAYRFHTIPDLFEGAPWNVTYLFDTALDLPDLAYYHPDQGDPPALETVTLTHKKGQGELTPATWAGIGWLESFAGPDLQSNQENLAGMGIRWQDFPTFTKATTV
jgi:hypothetical protein